MTAPSAIQALTQLSPTQTFIDGTVPPKRFNLRRYVLLVIFCLAQFLDAVSNTALFSAIPTLVTALDMSEAESTWIISAFQLTFASFLLVSGRISDVYNPKFAFIGGMYALGVLSFGSGFVTSKIPLIVIRALSGIAASLTIPSALALLTNVFPKPTEQARAIGLFGGCGAIGIALGLILGAMFVQWTSWPWVFWFVAVVSIPIATISVFLIPKQGHYADVDGRHGGRWKSLDLIGVFILAAALILFIFAVTSGTTAGWGTATVLAPLIISLFGIAGFILYETTIPFDRAAIPPRTWFLPNFLVLFGAALLPFLWWTAVFNVYTALWQSVWNWSAISAAVHLLPAGAVAFALSFTGSLSRVISPKWLILLGEGLCIIATILLALADTPSRYWSFIFPALVIGSAGTMLTYTHTNIAIFRTSPASTAGTVGAIFNGALQLGSAVGISAVGSIIEGVGAKHGVPTSYSGRAAAFWFLLAVVATEFVAVLVFYRRTSEDSQAAHALEREGQEGVGKVAEKGVEGCGCEDDVMEACEEPVVNSGQQTPALKDGEIV